MAVKPNLCRGLIGRILLLLPLAGLSACSFEVLSPSGYVAQQQRDVLVISTLLMLVIIVPVMIATVVFAWRYRASNKATYRPDWDHSTKLELLIWAAPLLIIVCLGALTWVGTHLLDPYRPLSHVAAGEPVAPDTEPLQVDVVALDWKWLFIYPEQNVASVNELAVPLDRPIEFSLTASTVMNAFYIPSMAGMIYAMPGMETTLHGVFNKAGEYQGLASHYSGAGFSGMRFKAKAMEPDRFEAWIAEARAGGDTLDRSRYLELEKPSRNVAPKTFASVEEHLFPRIVNMCVEDGKICMAEMMALDAEGGTGLAGTINLAALTHDKFGREGRRSPVFGWEPFKVVGFCSTAEMEEISGADPDESQQPVDTAPLRGRALARPQGFFDSARPGDIITQLGASPTGGADEL